MTAPGGRDERVGPGCRAGVAGLALARALAQQGVECTVAERRQLADAGLGMGLNLPGNATRALRRLGVLDRLLVVAVPVRRREYRNDRDRLLFAVETPASGATSRHRCACVTDS